MNNRLLLVDREFPSPFSEYRVGRVWLFKREDYLAVYLDCLLYRFTDTMVYAERAERHIYSSWPAIRDALRILQMDMILDDLADA